VVSSKLINANWRSKRKEKKSWYRHCKRKKEKMLDDPKDGDTGSGEKTLENAEDGKRTKKIKKKKKKRKKMLLLLLRIEKKEANQDNECKGEEGNEEENEEQNEEQNV
jgi:hypothetical protein